MGKVFKVIEIMTGRTVIIDESKEIAKKFNISVGSVSTKANEGYSINKRYKVLKQPESYKCNDCGCIDDINSFYRDSRGRVHGHKTCTSVKQKKRRTKNILKKNQDHTKKSMEYLDGFCDLCMNQGICYLTRGGNCDMKRFIHNHIKYQSNKIKELMS